MRGCRKVPTGVFFVLLTLGALLLGTPTVALAASEPKIEATYVWEGELAAQVNTEGLEGGGIYGAVYQFQLVRNTDEYATEIACPPRAQLKGTDGCGPGPEVEGALPIGTLSPKSGAQTVTLNLASIGATLTPGATYHFRVLAAPKIVTEDTLQWEPPPVYGPDATITTPAAEAPAVEGESASHVTPTDATLEATINPEDAERGALYQFQLVSNASEYPIEFSCPAAHEVFCPMHLPSDEGLPLGKTSPGTTGQSVALDLAKGGVTLKPGTTYHYRVITARFQQEEEGWGWKGPIVYGADQTFTTPPTGAPPVIESVSVSHLTETDATLEATLNTEGLATTYEFELWSSPCSHHGAGCEVMINVPIPSGSLLGSFVPQQVSVDLNSAGVTLRGGEYGVSLKATNALGSTTKSGGTFEPPEPAPSPLVTPPTTAQGQATSPGGGQHTPTGGPAPKSGPGTSPPHKLSAVQILHRAIKACERKPRRQRAGCIKRAHRQYATAVKSRANSR
jgi:hypothetical protein